MFGESDLGESPRVPSPWEAVLSVTPPKLVPEADQGNIEYKLQLLNPSPARFARLVTQLKWRLLEGGGQAYYELGVADSGALVGLGRVELERTLETLECMAGEIGASVVVVREIEVPKGLRVGVREAGKRRRGCDVEESPSPLTLDASPGLFPMDSDPDVPSLTLTPPMTVSEPEHSTDLEISTVYKPRPIRLSPSPSPSLHSNPLTVTRSQPHKHKWYSQKKHPPLDTPSPSSSETHTQGYANAQHRQTKQQAKALYRRLARDRRREEKRRFDSPNSLDSPDSALSTPNLNSDQNPPHEHPRIQDIQSSAAAAEELVHGLETLHVTVASTTAVPVPVSPTPTSPSPSPSDSRSNSESGESSPTSPAPSPCPSSTPASTSPSSSSTTSTLPALATTTTINSTNHHHIQALHNADDNADDNTDVNGCGKEEDDDDDDGVRLIVEALVVRKLSLEEAFLDFGGFSLV